MTTTTKRLCTDPRPAWTGPCRCRTCAELATIGAGLLAAWGWPAPHSEAADELVRTWRETQRRRAE